MIWVCRSPVLCRYRPPSLATRRLLAVTRDQGHEGVVLKRPASLYHPGRRTREWLQALGLEVTLARIPDPDPDRPASTVAA
jgi:hypothetical protein